MEEEKYNDEWRRVARGGGGGVIAGGLICFGSDAIFLMPIMYSTLYKQLCRERDEREI